MWKLLRLAPWGAPQIGGAFVVAVALAAVAVFVDMPLLTILPALLFLCVCLFFRNPTRIPPEDPLAVVSPADGRVTHIEERDEPDFIGGKALMVGIFLSVLDVHINRMPFAGTVRFIKYTPGVYHDARTEASSAENEANAVGIETDSPDAPRMLVKQIAGAVARRIVCDTEEGETHAAGEIFGMIKFGSRTELYIPVDAAFELSVSVGDTVRAGTTVVGRLENAS